MDDHAVEQVPWHLDVEFVPSVSTSTSTSVVRQARTSSRDPNKFSLRARALLYRDGAMVYLNVHATGTGLPTRTAYGDQRDACTNKAVVNQRVKKSAQPCPWLFHIVI